MCGEVRVPVVVTPVANPVEQFKPIGAVHVTDALQAVAGLTFTDWGGGHPGLKYNGAFVTTIVCVRVVTLAGVALSVKVYVMVKVPAAVKV